VGRKLARRVARDLPDKLDGILRLL
jgi:hypothetical protein